MDSGFSCRLDPGWHLRQAGHVGRGWKGISLAGLELGFKVRYVDLAALSRSRSVGRALDSCHMFT